MFEEMKAWLQTPAAEDYQFGYDDPYADYLGGVYYEAIEEVGRQKNDADIFVEPSIQGGRGGVFMTCKNGTTSWDFESECDMMIEFAEEAETEEEFKQSIVGFLLGKYDECVPEDEDGDLEDDTRYEEEDPDYEGCEEDEEDE